MLGGVRLCADLHCVDSNFSNLKFEYLREIIKQNHFSLFIRCPGGFEIDAWEEEKRHKISWHCAFEHWTTYVCSFIIFIIIITHAEILSISVSLSEIRNLFWSCA